MYRVELECNPDATFKVKSKDHEITVTTSDKGMSPPDVFLSGLVSCLGVYVRRYFAGSGLKLDDFGITAEAEFCREKPVSFKRIDISLDLKGAKLDERRQKALLEFIKNCPVHNTLKANPSVEIEMIK